MSKKIKTLTISALIVVISAGFVLGSVFANNLTNLRDERAEIMGEERRLRDQLTDIRETQDAIIIEMFEMDMKLQELTMAYLEASIDLAYTESMLRFAQAALYEAEESREAQQDNLRARIRFMHENGNFSYIEILFASASISDFLSNMNRINQVIERDHEILQNLLDIEYEIAARRDEIYFRLMEVELFNQELAFARAALDEAIALNIEMFARLTDEEHTSLYMLLSVEADRIEIDRQIRLQEQADARNRAATAHQRAAQLPPLQAGVRMGWPVQGFRQVNSHYGNRISPIRGGWEFHTGVDLRAPHGTNILAAEAGIVTFSGWSPGWGLRIDITHYDGLVTMYTHNSANLVSLGDYVSRGQVIARAGSTGDATGPHLHFEVRRNGRHIDPRPFLGY
ncbi:MAG: peptidoglycan DD-metalloendopeptidase family protein [Defluviitaleaceae bacterium]|nr:peptidoglycan DD-metalloendopeptidase family protein [Defluviitaleaceae bacterium]